MAKGRTHPLLEDLAGAIGDLVFYRDANGQLIIQRKGKRKAPLSAGQIAHNELFKRASEYGNAVQSDPELSAQYRPLCRGTRMRPYHVGVRDFLRAPVIESINLESFSGRPGQVIRIEAKDDTGVVRVIVLIRDMAKKVIEEGTAVLSLIQGLWLYTSQTEIDSQTSILVEATAVDRPGNEGTAKVHYFIE